MQSQEALQRLPISGSNSTQRRISTLIYDVKGVSGCEKCGVSAYRPDFGTEMDR
jgi:hypothetical protein